MHTCPDPLFKRGLKSIIYWMSWTSYIDQKLIFLELKSFFFLFGCSLWKEIDREGGGGKEVKMEREDCG